MALMRAAVVTGASGFVGRRLCALLDAPAALRLAGADWRQSIDAAPLEGAVVFHLAARVHGVPGASEEAYRLDNAEKTEALGRAAARRGSRLLVFLSSVKVLGEESAAPLGPAAPYAPQDAYARSKQAAEEALAAIATSTGLAVAVVRSPLVYGAGAGGNLASMLRWCDTPWPLPFGAVRNRRSWIHVGDLAAMLVACARSAPAGVATFHGAHPQPLGTGDVVRGLRAALGRPPRLVPVPARMLEVAGAAFGRGEMVRRLTRSLELDATAAYARLDWHPRCAPAEALAELARGEPRR